MEAVTATETDEASVADAAVLFMQVGLVEAATAKEGGERSVADAAVL